MKIKEMNSVCADKETNLYNLDVGMFFICLEHLYILISKKTMNGYRAVDVENGNIKMIHRDSMVLPLVSFSYTLAGNEK